MSQTQANARATDRTLLNVKRLRRNRGCDTPHLKSSVSRRELIKQRDDVGANEKTKEIRDENELRKKGLFIKPVRWGSVNERIGRTGMTRKRNDARDEKPVDLSERLSK
jgi:hypothetical protein